LAEALIVAAAWLAFNFGLLIWFCIMGKLEPEEPITIQAMLEEEMFEGRMSAEECFKFMEQFEDAK
jgi:hypothetical protein